VPRSAANLGEWVNEPYVTDPVIAFLKAAEFPVLMREVAEGCAIPVRCANRVLLRLEKKGRVSRHKLAMQRHLYCHKLKTVVPHAAKRMLFVYAWVDRAPSG